MRDFIKNPSDSYFTFPLRIISSILPFPLAQRKVNLTSTGSRIHRDAVEIRVEVLQLPNRKGEGRDHQYHPAPEAMNRKHPAPKGLLAFNRQQNVLPMHGSSRPAHDSRRGSSRSRFPQTSHPSEALRVRSLSSRLTETHVTDEHRQDIPSDDFRRLEEDQAHLKEELRDTRRDLQKALGFCSAAAIRCAESPGRRERSSREG